MTSEDARGGGDEAARAGHGPEGDVPDAAWRGWRDAAEHALYGPGGFYRRAEGPGPAGHFRTSVHASPLFARAVAVLLRRLDLALGHPPRLDLVDVGAGRGELLTGVLAELSGQDGAAEGRAAAAPAPLRDRLRLRAVERAPRPRGLDDRVLWSDRLPDPRTVLGLVFANEWLDNVPLDIAGADGQGVVRYVQVRPEDGAERLGPPVAAEDAAWLASWWPTGPGANAEDAEDPEDTVDAVDAEDTVGAGTAKAAAPARGAGHGGVDTAGWRGEIGRTRDLAWRRAVASLRAGLAVAVDYHHDRADRPPFGTLTGFREGREVRPVPDGTCDLTAHVALDACAAAGASAARASTSGEAGRPGASPVLLTQRAALRSLGVEGGRPPLSLATTDPAGYLLALSRAGEAAELTDPSGLGAFGWLLQPVAVDPTGLLGPVGG